MKIGGVAQLCHSKCWGISQTLASCCDCLLICPDSDEDRCQGVTWQTAATKHNLHLNYVEATRMLLLFLFRDCKQALLWMLQQTSSPVCVCVCLIKAGYSVGLCNRADDKSPDCSPFCHSVFQVKQSPSCIKPALALSPFVFHVQCTRGSVQSARRTLRESGSFVWHL